MSGEEREGKRGRICSDIKRGESKVGGNFSRTSEVLVFYPTCRAQESDSESRIHSRPAPSRLPRGWERRTA